MQPGRLKTLLGEGEAESETESEKEGEEECVRGARLCVAFFYHSSSWLAVLLVRRK